jgi:NitT/TauT family transport system permease protein
MPKDVFKNNSSRIFRSPALATSTPNHWDAIALALIFGILIMVAWGAAQMATPFNLGQPTTISLNPKYLPNYALRTVLRLFIGLFFSLLFTFAVGAMAAKNKRAEKFIIPIIDIMQSVPILSFLSISVAGFIAMFKGSMLGPECAAIFVIFTSQVWNMTLSFYQSLSTVPKDLSEVATVFKLSSWQRFWRIEVPFSMPGLLWNMMVSMSGSWFFVTASEAFSVANQNITLPGIGSYIALAIVHANSAAILYAVTTMLLVIFLYDQLLFRPLVQWSTKFKIEEILEEKEAHSLVTDLFRNTRLVRRSGAVIVKIFDSFVNIPFLNPQPTYTVKPKSKSVSIFQRTIVIGVNLFLVVALFAALAAIVLFLRRTVTLNDVRETLFLGLITGARVMILIFLCSLIWVPIGVWIGFRPRVAQIIQPVVQFLAAFPANLLFPIVTIAIIKYGLNVNIWVSPLMVLGTQWYILFNVIAGASTIPQDLKLAAKSFGIKGWLRWRRLILPGIFPYFITGAITASGGAWNASIIAETVSWGATKLHAIGLGGYITQCTSQGDFPHIILGTITMCVFVLIINRILWRPLYNVVIERFRTE